MKKDFQDSHKLSKLRKEYESEFEFMKVTNYELWLWNISNSKYIEYLENIVNNGPFPKLWVLYYKDFLNLNSDPQIKIYRRKKSAYKAYFRLLNIEYYKWYNKRITYGKRRIGETPHFDNCFFVKELDIRP